MTNKKNIIWCSSITALVVLQVIIINLDILSWLKVVLSSCIFALEIALLVISHRNAIRANKKVQIETEEKAKKITDPTLLDVYAILQIPPQYNADGSLKDVHQLLGIAPQYDETGKRILTIYEKLGINPKFRADGTEVPSVVRIKNRINSIVKLQEAPPPLVHVSKQAQTVGEKHILPEPILVDKNQPTQQQKPPVTIKPVVVKKDAKPSKPSTPNYGSAPAKVSVKKSEIKHPKILFIGDSSTMPSKTIFDVAAKEVKKVVQEVKEVAKDVVDAVREIPEAVINKVNETKVQQPNSNQTKTSASVKSKTNNDHSNGSLFFTIGNFHYAESEQGQELGE